MHFDDLRQALCTVVTVPITPFDADGQVDLGALRGVVDRLTAGGVHAITPNGNTGEFYSLSVAECAQTVRATVAATSAQEVVIAGVGHDTATASEMAQTAAEAGADAIMIHQVVNPNRSAAGWLAYHQAIAASVPELGVVPYIRDGQVTAAMLTALLEACPNVIGVKYAVADPLLFATLVAQVGGDRLAWICGMAELWAPFLWVGGARGFTSGLVNVSTTRSLAMLACLRAGDYAGAMKLWAELKPFEDLRARNGHANNVPVIKEALAQLGLGTRVVRPPITEISPDERAEVAAVLAAWEIAAPVAA
jgi:4-hydroxy-tetrahydrodipicolinate synthase